MFNTIKKFAHSLSAAISGTTARPMRKRDNVVALPVKPPVEGNGKALADARRSLVNTLQQVVDVRRNALVEEVIDLLDDGAANDDFAAGDIVLCLHYLGIFCREDLSKDEWHALTAAVEYYSGYLTVDLAMAVEVVQSGDYRYYRRAYDEELLGLEIYREWLDTNGIPYLPDWLTEAVDFEGIGRNAIDDYGFANNKGKFTANGYFRPFDD